MVTIHPEINQRPSQHIPQAPNLNHLTQLSIRARHTRSISGSTPPVHFGDHHHHHQSQHLHPYHQALSSPCPFPPSEMHESVLREMEKQRIREQIIMTEILRRRILEDEVRKELMMEREMDFRRGSNNDIPFGSSSSFIGSQPLLRLPLLGIGGGKTMSSEERIMLSLAEKEKMLNGMSTGFGILPTSSVSEAKPVLERSHEKRKLIILASSDDENPRLSKRKALDSNESPTDGKKKAKEWFCIVCHISTNSEQALAEHMKGKKHKSMEQRSGKKNYSIGFSSKKAAISVEACPAEPVKKILDTNVSKKKDVRGVIVPEVHEKKDGDSKKNSHRFWCEICNVGSNSQRVMKDHQSGRKHALRLEATKRNARQKEEKSSQS